jgi:tetratricopeptide (TPR) repeat protein
VRELEAQACWWRGDYEAAERAAEAAIELVGRRRATWYAALGTAAGASFPLGHKDKVSAAGRTLAVHQPAPSDWPTYLRAAARVAPLLYNAGDVEVADALMRKVEVGRARSDTKDPSLQARVSTASAVRAKTRGDAGGYLADTEAAIGLAQAAGDLRYACMLGVNGGFALVELGQWARALERLLGALAVATRLGLSSIASAARLNLGLALGRLGRHDDGWAEMDRAMEELAGQGNRRLAGSAAVYLARLALDRGDPQLAEQKARAAIGILGEGFSMRPYALATLARALLDQGRIPEAADLARDAASLLSGTATPEGEAFVRLVHAETLAASGNTIAARSALASAAERVHERAARLSDEMLRASFLQSIPEHARIVSLSQEWSTS